MKVQNGNTFTKETLEMESRGESSLLVHLYSLKKTSFGNGDRVFLDEKGLVDHLIWKSMLLCIFSH